MILASRPFVAIRPTTYESAKERDYLLGLYQGRSGQMENSTFALLKSDGKTPLSPISRGPERVFGSSVRMAEAMRLISAKQTTKETPGRLKTSPALANLRLAINVAACDNLPLVVLGPAAGPGFEAAMTDLFFDSPWQGRFVLCQGNASEMGKLLHLDGGKVPAMAVVQADPFGLSGRILARLDPGDKGGKLADTLALGAAGFQATARNFRGHLTAGFEAGAFWETAIPVTDLQENRARARHPAAKITPSSRP